MFRRRAALPALLAASALTLAGCGASSAGSDDGIQVLASIYPLAYAAERVGGDLVSVSTATPAGTDPHSVELSPRQLRDVGDADLVVYLGGFQAAVDEAVSERAPDHALDVATVADLQPLPAGAADEHADDEHGGLDPHFWLDTERLAAAARAIADDLARVDPDHAQTYRANAGVLADELAALDDEYAAALTTCDSDVVVTSHAAFGYLTERYGLRQVSVSGIDPEGEPSPARIRAVRETIADLGVTAVFTEPLADPAVAATLAEDLGVDVLQLDPLDSHDPDAPDYREVMATNLDALRTGLGCA
ncbi:hypothetical protein N867_13745 [Actinotalea fermentans ATCC 43279 = JCM 9966 = DSM 3133]|nr:hypothetical protein N867_13745 [Actinotalea fermentans ATCC 43279 = JCM 9966 = DSM 3133]